MKPAELARRTGYSPQTISDKLNGNNRIRLSDLSSMSEALNVEPFVLLMDPDEALRWALDHRESGSILSNLGWNVPIPPVSHITQCDLLRAA